MSVDASNLLEGTTPGPWDFEQGRDGDFAIYARTPQFGTQLLGEFYDEDMGDDLPAARNLALAASAPILAAALIAKDDEIAALRVKADALAGLVQQYGDDLKRPPSADSKERRLDVIASALKSYRGATS